MMKLRAAEARGKANFGWLDARHSFSFGHYYDPEWMGHSGPAGHQPGSGGAGWRFHHHPHANMEILTCAERQTIEHKDSLGHAEQIPGGDFQLMSAGSGIRHSEYNPRTPSCSPCCKSGSSRTNTARLPVISRRRSSKPGMTLVASPDGEAGSFSRIRQQAKVWRLQLAEGRPSSGHCWTSWLPAYDFRS